MKSFPSSFTKNDLVNQGGLASVNIKQTLKNMAGATMNGILSGGDTGLATKDSLGENLRWEDYDYDDSIKTSNFTLDNNLHDTTVRMFRQTTDENKAVYENVSKIPAVILASMNKYRRIYKSSAIQFGSRAKADKDDPDYHIDYYQQGVAQSLFNPWYGVSFQGFTIHTPLISNGIDKSTTIESLKNNSLEDAKESFTIQTNNSSPDFTDCSIKTLVNLSGGNGVSEKNLLGRATYKYADFMYCKDLGKVSNNHLITLRKFPTPIGDNIMKDVKGNERQTMASATLISWFGTDDNKLEDICKFSVASTWKEIESKIQDIQSKEDDPHILNSLVNTMSSGYNSMFKKGLVGSNNVFYGWLAGKMGMAGANQGSYENQLDAYYYRDERYSWTPKNTIQSFYDYEGKLVFNHSFTLNFSYKLRSYDGINPKSAFLDLLGNILEMTYRRGSFWGGSHRWLGAPANPQAWKKINNIFDKIESGAENVIDELFGVSDLSDLASVFGSLLQSAGELLTQAKDAVVDGINKRGGVKEVAKDLTKKGLGVTMAMLKNKLGRPAIYAMSTIAQDGKATHQGIWHLTVGNPRNPILTIGNLIMENAEISQSGPLGIDDFPTEIKVTVQLKHARPRDITNIGEMYTCGQSGLLLPLNSKKIEQFINMTDPSVDLGMSGMNYVMGNPSPVITSIDEKTGKISDNSISSSEGKDNVHPVWSNLGKV